ncbi:N-alpha-acetyltransferase 38, NatC auxiliary subunit-like [Daphnia pulicaria]|nr:N-alpha-acetyltransferase 38, NatC auxiliary subunit-like [Daphnia pulicaria]
MHGNGEKMDGLSKLENIEMVDISKESSKEKELTMKVKSPGRLKLESWLNAVMKIEIEDGRTLIGQFLCTDRDCNIILGSCYEYPPPDDNAAEEPRVLGLAMVPGKYIVSISVDDLMVHNSPYIT